MLAADIAHADGISCPNNQVTLFAAGSAEVGGTCRVAEAVRVFLDANGMEMPDALAIHFVDLAGWPPATQKEVRAVQHRAVRRPLLETVALVVDRGDVEVP